MEVDLEQSSTYSTIVLHHAIVITNFQVRLKNTI